jgi:hypothetical protein
VDKLSAMLPLLALGALGVVNVVAIGAWRHASTAEELGEGASSYCVIRTSDPRCCAKSAGDADRRARARASGTAGGAKVGQSANAGVPVPGV